MSHQFSPKSFNRINFVGQPFGIIQRPARVR